MKTAYKMTGEKEEDLPIMDEDSMDEPDKEAMSGDDVNNEEKVTEEMNGKNTEDEDEEEERSAKENSDEDSDSEDSESEGSDSLDEEEAELRRTRYVGDMTDLEKQFSDLKEQLYKERIAQIEEQLGEVNHSETREYTGPLKQLEEECKNRLEVAGHLKHYRTINLENKLQCELQAAEQHFQNEEHNLIAMLTADFEEKLKKVEEERHTAEMYSDLWCDDLFRSRKKRKSMEMFVPEKRKKPANVVGPYIIYMLNEMDVLEDWAAIRKAKTDLARRKAKELSVQEKDPLITACYKDGKFLYQGEWFEKGEQVTLDNRIDAPVSATITAINTGEVWVSKRDGVKCKLYIAQFQKGKYTIQKCMEVLA